MARGPRLDAPGAVHHVIARGIERRPIFRCDRDRRRCLDRLAAAIAGSGAALYAWALMPNHVHALIRTGVKPLGRLMQSWIGAYASDFNRRHRRAGHLFQNRFKSILVEEDIYFLELVRYIHLNPVRAGLLADLRELDRYPWTGHAVLLGRRDFAAQNIALVLAQFGNDAAIARAEYLTFARTAPRLTHDLRGGALRRAPDGWEFLARVDRGRERWGRDERILAAPAFVAAMVDGPAPAPRPHRDAEATVDWLCETAARRFELTPAQVASPSQRPGALAARAVVCHLAVCRFGFTLSAVARSLGVSRQSVYRAVDRARSLPAGLLEIDAVG